MSTVSNKIIQAAAGSNGNGATGEFITSTHSNVSSLSLQSSGGAVTPQVGDLIIAHSGGYSNGASLFSSFTQVVGKFSSPWYSNIYFEGSTIGYRIATDSTRSFSVGNPDVALSLYRFSSPVTSVTSAFTTTQQGGGNKTISTSSYDKPHIVVCTIGSNGDPNLAMTNSDYSSRVGYCDAAASLRNPDSSLTTAVITASSASFYPACSYAVLVPNFD